MKNLEGRLQLKNRMKIYKNQFNKFRKKHLYFKKNSCKKDNIYRIKLIKVIIVLIVEIEPNIVLVIFLALQVNKVHKLMNIFHLSLTQL